MIKKLLLAVLIVQAEANILLALSNGPNSFDLCSKRVETCVLKCNKKHQYRIQKGPTGANLYEIRTKNAEVWKQVNQIVAEKFAHQNLLCGRKCLRIGCLKVAKAAAATLNPTCKVEVLKCRQQQCPNSSDFYFKGKPLDKKQIKKQKMKAHKKNKKFRRAAGKKLAQVPGINSKVLADNRKRISVSKQFGKVTKEQNKLQTARQQKLKHDIKRSVENSSEKRIDSRTAKNQAKEAYIAGKSLKKVGELAREYNRSIREKFFEKIATYNSKKIGDLEKSIFNGSLNLTNSLTGSLFKDIKDYYMVKSDLENSILNYLAEDSMMLDHYINEIIGDELNVDKKTDNYLMDRLSTYRKLVDFEFWKEIDWLDIIRNFKKFAGFHGDDEKIIQSEINFEEFWYIRRYLQRKIYFIDNIMHFVKNYDELKSFVGDITKKVMNHENKKQDEYFGAESELESMANKILNTEQNLYEDYEKVAWKEDKVMLKVGIKAGEELRNWHKEKLKLPDWCMLSCAGEICLPYMKIDAFEAHVNQYLEAQYSIAKTKFQSGSIKTPKLKKL